MLLRFSVANFGSIRDEQQLSMIASTLKDDPSGLIETPALRTEKVLPAAVIYGANASGKSNLVRALAHMEVLVRNSHRHGEPGAPIPLRPFLLDPAYATKPSLFSIDFIWNGARYAYRFEALGNEFKQESLHVWRGGPVTLLFEREGQEFKFGRSLKGRNKIIEELTRPNSLFLSAAAQNNHAQLNSIASFLSTILVDIIDLDDDLKLNLAVKDNQRLERISAILSHIDSSISDSRVVYRNNDKKSLDIFDKLISNLIPDTTKIERDTILSEMFDKKVELGHRTTSGDILYFDLEHESKGTVQLLLAIAHVLLAIDFGRIVVIDEFGSRVHTRASELILSLFTSKETNPKGAQLIVTTHDTNLLNAPGLRRDQIWFTEKDAGGATHLYPLTDIETRKGDNLEKGYLQGRFGAIPFAGPAAELLKSN